MCVFFCGKAPVFINPGGYKIFFDRAENAGNDWSTPPPATFFLILRNEGLIRQLFRENGAKDHPSLKRHIETCTGGLHGVGAHNPPRQ